MQLSKALEGYKISALIERYSQLTLIPGERSRQLITPILIYDDHRFASQSSFFGSSNPAIKVPCA